MSCRMGTQIQMVAHEKIDESFLTQVRLWANEVLEMAEFPSPPPLLCITIWKTMKEFQAFCQREKKKLGIVTGEETDFLATHDAWRGYPRIHVCEERLIGIPSVIIQGVIHHEIGHALHHGTLEFYTFVSQAGFRRRDFPVVLIYPFFNKVSTSSQWPLKIGK